MLSIGNSVSGSGTPPPLETRAAVSTGILPNLNQTDTASAGGGEDFGSGGQRIPAYNAFEFVYRPDYGKIILLEQNAETGQEVTQIPTEYHLQQYAAQERAQRSGQQQKLFQGTHGQGSPGTTGKAGHAAAASGGTSGTGMAAAPPPAQPAAPSVAVAAPSPHVDIKV